MNILEAILLGVSLAMDALAVSVALGAVERKNFDWSKIFITAFAFGLFQFVMPLIGWLGGNVCGNLVQTYGRYIACGLLAFLGGKMIYEARKGGEEEEIKGFNFSRLIVLSLATSIDALLVGVSYSCLTRVHVIADFVIIGVVTFLISAGGCIFGKHCGNILGNKCEIIGGLVLIAIALKILILG